MSSKKRVAVCNKSGVSFRRGECRSWRIHWAVCFRMTSCAISPNCMPAYISRSRQPTRLRLFSKANGRAWALLTPWCPISPPSLGIHNAHVIWFFMFAAFPDVCWSPVDLPSLICHGKNLRARNCEFAFLCLASMCLLLAGQRED